MNFPQFYRATQHFSVCVCCWPAKTFLSTLSWPFWRFFWRFWASLKLFCPTYLSRKGTTLVSRFWPFAALFFPPSALALTFGASAPCTCLPRRECYRCLFTCQRACASTRLTCVSLQLAEHLLHQLANGDSWPQVKLSSWEDIAH